MAGFIFTRLHEVVRLLVARGPGLVSIRQAITAKPLPSHISCQKGMAEFARLLVVGLEERQLRLRLCGQ
jgi:hypothetical protein